ncbi:hypothetical protein QYE76_049620 [Lolium multiflorum]|uniref:DUF6598 domain-containing protein n=1 Tax=Lolium multiflorum TaxID=4521 RepID=A0AAD8SQ91_LOLMU|nr:hypothetical protein QYE76_049620 [Lolium multiflorum]
MPCIGRNRRRSSDTLNQEEDQKDGRNAGCYFTSKMWKNDNITTVPPMRLTDHPSRYTTSDDSLQIESIKILSRRGAIRCPIDVFGMITVRDVLDNRTRNIIFAHARSNCQTIDEEHPYLQLIGPMRAIVTCIDPGNIEIALKVKGVTESEDRDLSFLVLLLKSSMYISYHGDYSSKRSTLKLEFHHMAGAVEATIGVRLITGGSSLPLGDFQGVFTASIDNIDDMEILLLAFRGGKLSFADDGTVNLSRRVINVGLRDREELKVSIVARCEEEEHVAIKR